MANESTTLEARSEALTVEVRDVAGTAMVALTGALGCGTCGRLRAVLSSLARRGQSIRVELSAVGSVDACGVRCLLVAHRAAAGEGGSLVVVSWSPQVERRLRSWGLCDLLAAEELTGSRRFVRATCTLEGCDHTVLTCPRFTEADYRVGPGVRDGGAGDHARSRPRTAATSATVSPGPPS